MHVPDHIEMYYTNSFIGYNIWQHVSITIMHVQVHIHGVSHIPICRCMLEVIIRVLNNLYQQLSGCMIGVAAKPMHILWDARIQGVIANQ